MGGLRSRLLVASGAWGDSEWPLGPEGGALELAPEIWLEKGGCVCQMSHFVYKSQQQVGI